jgi:hypothetical protein
MTEITQKLRSLCGPLFSTKFSQNFDMKKIMISGFFMKKKAEVHQFQRKKNPNYTDFKDKFQQVATNIEGL